VQNPAALNTFGKENNVKLVIEFSQLEPSTLVTYISRFFTTGFHSVEEI
jgi:hypothetical protein